MSNPDEIGNGSQPLSPLSPLSPSHRYRPSRRQQYPNQLSPSSAAVVSTPSAVLPSPSGYSNDVIIPEVDDEYDNDDEVETAMVQSASFDQDDDNNNSMAEQDGVGAATNGNGRFEGLLPVSIPVPSMGPNEAMDITGSRSMGLRSGGMAEAVTAITARRRAVDASDLRTCALVQTHMKALKSAPPGSR